jgi:hypothetical protein
VAVTAPFGVGAFTKANLKAAATVYDAFRAVVTVLKPPRGFAMAVPESTIQLPSSGVYYISVTGIGADTPATGGYSNYGSLGWYELTVTFQPPGALLTSDDCTGIWSEWSPCSDSCKQTRSYSVTREAGVDAAACPFGNGETRSRSCSGGKCSRAVVGRRDCVGSWSPWSSCNASCRQTATYFVTALAVNGGADCSCSDGAKRSQDCTGGECILEPTVGDSKNAPDVNDNVMVITAIKVTREVPHSNRTVQYHYCKALVTLRSTLGRPVAKASVTGTWSAPGEDAPNAAAALADTRKSGQAVFRSRAWKAVGGAGECEFTVSDVQFTGKLWDRSASVTSSAFAWASYP